MLQIKIRFDDVTSLVNFVNDNVSRLQTTGHEASAMIGSIETNTSSEMSRVLADISETIIVDDLDMDILDD